MDNALWWSGLISWITLGVFGLWVLIDWVLEYTLASFRFKKAFLEWSWEQIKAKRRARGLDIPGG